MSNPLFEKELNEERLPDYLCFEYIPTTETMFKNVYKMEPGSYFTFSDGKFETKRYFTPEYSIDDTKSIEYWEDLIDETFKGSTVAHGISDVEVGCFLSSGVDSSYVVHEMAKRNDVKTFSVGYADGKIFGAIPCTGIAKHENVKNFSKKITAEEYFNITPMVQYYMDEPLPNPSAIALYFLANLASQSGKRSFCRARVPMSFSAAIIITESRLISQIYALAAGPSQYARRYRRKKCPRSTARGF